MTNAQKLRGLIGSWVLVLDNGNCVLGQLKDVHRQDLEVWSHGRRFNFELAKVSKVTLKPPTIHCS